MNNVLVIENISKHFFDDNSACKAIENVSLTLRKHEIVCLMGPSGCGKSTILRIISGLDTADSGVVYDDNKELTHSSEKVKTAMVFQDHGLFPWLSVRENIAYGLHLKVRSSSEIIDNVVSNFWFLFEWRSLQMPFLINSRGG